MYQIFWSLINQGNFVSFLKKNGNFVSFTKGTPYTFGIKEHTTSIITSTLLINRETFTAPKSNEAYTRATPKNTKGKTFREGCSLYFVHV